MKVQLVYPKQDVGSSWMGNAYVPGGLVSIASTLKSRNPQIDLEILDERFVDDLEKRLSNGVIGISVNTMSYQNGLRIAQLAKSKGARVVFGGPHATALAKEILANRDYVDAVIKYKGEDAFSNYVKGVDKKDIHNLVWKSGDKIIENEVNFPQKRIDELPALDFNFLDMERYFKEQRGLPWLSGRAVYILTHEGCVWREKTGGCIFCSLQDSKRTNRDPVKVWKDIKNLQREFGVDYIKDFGDDIAGDPDWLEEFVRQKPTGINLKFSCYLSAKYINNHVADLLARLNTVHGYLGFESGSNQMLRALRKGGTKESNLRAARTLAQKGITIMSSFVLGGPGESEATVRETFDSAKEIASLGNVALTSADILVPLPGSQSFKLLLKKFPKYQGTDLFDLQELKRDWINTFCNIDYETIRKYSREIEGLSKIRNDFSGD